MDKSKHVVIRVWVSLVSARSPGHASLAIRPNAKTPLEGYVSFAPATQRSMYGPGKFFKWADDKKEYIDSGRGMWIGVIFGLDVDKMARQFSQDHQRPQTYGPLNECATQVHRYLEIGGGDKYASLSAANVLPPWSPDDAEDYARSIVQATEDFGSYSTKVVGKGTHNFSLF